MPYVTKPRLVKANDDEDDYEPSLTARTVHEIDDDAEFTGLLDAQGNPLYRVPERCKMGFVK